MSTRFAASALGLTLLLAACGQQTAHSPADTPVAAAPEQGSGPAPLVGVNNPDAIPGQYIVVFKADAASSNLSAQGVGGVVRTLGLDPQGVTVQHLYTAALSGFAGRLSAQNLAQLQADPRVAYIEQDGVVRASVTQGGATWGLDRLNQRDLPLDSSYSYTYTGDGVRAYIIDTGLDTGHAEFEGRAQNVYDAFGSGGNDCNGHGTHVGGTVGGRTYGVAKRALLRGVKVLDCDGSGSTSGIISAVDWVAKNHVKPAVANMSLGGGYSSALNGAVVNLSNVGVFVAVAAGNENQDACNVSPASAAYGSAVTAVAASDRTDTKASFSNYGRCVDLYAPGAGITAAWIGGGTTETNTISGTSMASPHVAGVAALVKSRYGDVSSASVWSYVSGAATASKIRSNPSGTPNVLLHKYTTAW